MEEEKEYNGFWKKFAYFLWFIIVVLFGYLIYLLFDFIKIIFYGLFS